MAATARVCNYNKFGYCRFGDKCNLTHNNQVCDKTGCPVANCDFRHPKQCKYFKTYQRCKFTTYCSYKHDENLTNSENMKTKMHTFEDNVSKLEKSLEVAEKKIESLKKMIKKHENFTMDLLEKIFETQKESFTNVEIEIKEKITDKMEIIVAKVDENSETVDFVKEKWTIAIRNLLLCSICNYIQISSVKNVRKN